MGDLLSETAITYPMAYTQIMTGTAIKAMMEDVCDNLFNPNPYYQQGGDMVRVGGLKYAIDPEAKIGSRIGAMELNGKPLRADKKYKVAGWASVQPGVKGEPIWDVVARHLRGQKSVSVKSVNTPVIKGSAKNPGYEPL